MHEVGFLKDLVIVLGAAVVVVALLRRVGVPSIAGFILTGVICGPTALRLVDDTHQVEVLAEIGVVLLLFGIGLEFSLDRLQRLWRAVLWGGSIQVAITVVVTAVVAHLFGLAVGAAVFVGCVIAVSSTAIVLRGLSARGEVGAPHGRLAVGILVFQDLCVVPMMLALPFMAGQGGPTTEVLFTAAKALAILAGVLFAGTKLAPRALAFVAQTKERDLFILAVFLVCFGTAWVVSLAGISLALGAFLAGLVVAGSEFRHQALSDLIPTREVFASLFFVSVGMLLNIANLREQWLPTVLLLLAIILGKFVIVLATALILRLNLRISILAAATLCQVGEFSFVLLNAADGVLEPMLADNLLVAIILSMLLTPVAIAAAPHLATSASRIARLQKLVRRQAEQGAEVAQPSCYIIVAGYGLAGRAVCQALKGAHMAYLAVDMNPDNIRAAKKAGDQAVLGDITQHEIVEELGCKHAQLVVLSINDAQATERATRMIHKIAPEVPILARAPYESDRESLVAAGAANVVVAEAAASTALVQASLSALARSSTTTTPVGPRGLEEVTELG